MKRFLTVTLLVTLLALLTGCAQLINGNGNQEKTLACRPNATQALSRDFEKVKTMEDTGNTIIIFQEIFKDNSANLTEQGELKLALVASKVSALELVKVQIVCQTNAQNKWHALGLAQARAEKIQSFLKERTELLASVESKTGERMNRIIITP